jgi:hypothetical protein
MNLDSPPEPRRSQFHQRAIGVAHVEAHPAAGPAILANDVHAPFREPLTPGVEILGLDREREVQAPATVVPGNLAARLDQVALGRAGLKHQQDALLRNLKSGKARRVDERLEAEQIAIKRRRALKVARIKLCLKEAIDRRRAVLLRHRLLRTRSF